MDAAVGAESRSTCACNAAALVFSCTMAATQGISPENGAHAIIEGQPAPAAMPPSGAMAEDVRVAMALNGGVSLAVWMGGCAVELDAARRAHLPGVIPVSAALCEEFSREVALV